MYPFVRSFLEVARSRRMPPLGLFGTHVSHHRIWPQDIDTWAELNNGRTLTLYDLGRLALFHRLGLIGAAFEAGMYFTVAGVSVRFRGRVRPLAVVEMRSRILGWDERFFYVEQSMWTGDTCANQMLLRAAVARRAMGIVPPAEVVALVGTSDASPELPDWVCNWIEAEASRPWPPA